MCCKTAIYTSISGPQWTAEYKSSADTPSAIISFSTVSRRLLRARNPQFLLAFEAKAIDCHSGISPQNLSLWPILSKAVDCVVLVRVFNTLFLNDNSARRFRKVRKSTARVRESWIKPEH